MNSRAHRLYEKLTFNSYGTAKSGVGISAMSILRPDLMIRCSIPVVMAGIIAVSVRAYTPKLSLLTHLPLQIYGLVVSVLISSGCATALLAVLSLALTASFSTCHSGCANDFVRWLLTTRCRLKCWTRWTRSWVRHRYRRRCGCPRHSAAAPTICRHGAFFFFIF